jgi:hypothetical protein
MIKIKNFILFKEVAYWYNSIVNYINFYYARKKADRMHKLTGKRYHVVPGAKNKLIVVDNTFVKIYNEKAKNIKGTKRIDFDDLIKMSYYSTSMQSVTRK